MTMPAIAPPDRPAGAAAAVAEDVAVGARDVLLDVDVDEDTEEEDVVVEEAEVDVDESMELAGLEELVGECLDGGGESGEGGDGEGGESAYAGSSEPGKRPRSPPISHCVSPPLPGLGRLQV